ncbi:MAG TPA: exodeoxyribonuclease VII large subunit [Gaiellaceae bacterium]|nr:exodeoxyribonuclease VII large subunit [Gaiellaceae bacterium]
MAKVEAIDYGERKVYSVAAFNRGLADWVGRLPTVWVEGEVTELRRQERWQTVFFTLKDVAGGACLEAAMPRRRFDALRLDLADGERVHVFGRAEIWAQKGELRLQALSIERFGLGAHLAALERLKQQLAAEGLFAPERKRPLPRLPRRIGLVTGNDAAARRDVIAAVTARFPPARLLVAETRVQGPRAAAEMAGALRAVAAEPEVDVVVLTRGGGSFEDLLPFSDEGLVRAVAACPVPLVSAVGHEQDTPLCDLAADVRASTPTAAARLVVPDLAELVAALDRRREALRREARAVVGRRRERLERERDRLRSGGRLLLERRRTALDHGAARLRALSPRSTLARGYAIVRHDDAVLRSTAALSAGDRVDVALAEGSFGARVDEIAP